MTQFTDLGKDENGWTIGNCTHCKSKGVLVAKHVCENTPSIEDFFDVDNEQHLKAYKVLNETAMWPEGFIPENMTFSPCWSMLLASKLADAYIKLKL